MDFGFFMMSKSPGDISGSSRERGTYFLIYTPRNRSLVLQYIT